MASNAGPKKVRPEDVLTLPMAPLLDVVMQILCFFVVTYEIDKAETHLVVTTPSPMPGKGPELELLKIQIHSGRYQLLGKPMPLEAMGDMLAGFARKDPKTTVIVEVSQRARAEQVVNVLDLCNKVGLENLSVMTLKGEASL